MSWPIWIAIWLVCGFVAYGITKGGARRSYESMRYIGHDIDTEFICLMFFIFGPYGLTVALFAAICDWKLSFCIKMPAELKRGHNERI